MSKSFNDMVALETGDRTAMVDPSHSNLSVCIPDINIISHSQPGSRRQTAEKEVLLAHHNRFSQQRRSSAMVPKQRLLLDILQNSVLGSRLSINTLDKSRDSQSVRSIAPQKSYNRRVADDNMATLLSTFYAKFIVVLGISFPVTDILSYKAPPSFYQGFYLYLYLVSIAFIVFMLFEHLRQKAEMAAMFYTYQTKGKETSGDVGERGRGSIGGDADSPAKLTGETPKVRLGSFYLRIGAVAFGIGSMVYSGLEFGQYFELKKDPRCQNVLIALNPAARMLLTILQMQLIFLNNKDIGLRRHRIIARFGLMHMIATNLCEWLYVLVEETKHEIVHLAHKKQHQISMYNTTSAPEIVHQMTKRATAMEILVECRRTNIMGSLVQNASPFLFPCTIEFSLICAVTLFEMWKTMRGLKKPLVKQQKTSTNEKGSNFFTVDCTRAHRGLFGGILITVLTIISLIMYFQIFENPKYTKLATFEVTLSELILFTFTLVAVLAAMYRVRDLRLTRCDAELALDCTLLVVAQSGIYIYAMFSIVGTYFSLTPKDMTDGVLALVTEVLSLAQTSIQTIFVLNTWWRRCRSSREIRMKPGREIVTFLIVANMALWTINTLIKGRAAFRPTHLKFFGQWAWTIITHVSMPLAIFYRFHSTICLFEIWKTTYKAKSSQSVRH